MKPESKLIRSVVAKTSPIMEDFLLYDQTVVKRHQIESYEIRQLNRHIEIGWRDSLTPTQCFKSLHYRHNQAGNIISHFVALCHCAYVLNREVCDEDFLEKAPKAVVILFVQLMAFQICLLCSTVYHLFQCISIEFHQNFFGCDVW